MRYTVDLASQQPLEEIAREADDQTMNVPPEKLDGLLLALIEQARSLAARMTGGDPEREVPCHFCAGPVPLWENLLVQQLAGVPAHVQCPADLLQARLRESGPLADFPYDDFSAAVDRRLARETPAQISGEIVGAK